MCKISQAGITKIFQNPALVPQAKLSNSALPSLFEWFEDSHPKSLNMVQSAAAVTVLDFYSLAPETFPSSWEPGVTIDNGSHSPGCK